MSFRFPYLALDIETTGLDRQRSHVLQLAAVYDNGRDLKDLPTFNQVVQWPVLTYGEEYAMSMNRSLLEQREGRATIQQVQKAFSEFLDKIQPNGKFFVAGKNVGSFDIPILTNPTNGFVFKRFFHRYLDPGSMYTEHFKHIPNQDEINKLVGRNKVSHNALDDTWDVVYAVRYIWKV